MRAHSYSPISGAIYNWAQNLALIMWMHGIETSFAECTCEDFVTQFWECHNYNWGGIEIYAVAHLGQLWVWGSWLKRRRKVAEVVLVHLTLSDRCQMGVFSKYKALYVLILSRLKVELEEQVKCLSVWPSAKDWHWETFLKTAPFPNFGSLVCRAACFYIADI